MALARISSLFALTLVAACGSLADGTLAPSGAGKDDGGGANGSTTGPGGSEKLAGSTQWTQAVTGVDVFFKIDALTATPDGGAAFVGSIAPSWTRPIIERVDGSGAQLWRRTIESSSIEPGTLAADGSGALYLGGRYSGAVDFGGPQLADAGAFVARLGPAGNTQWVWTDPKAWIDGAIDVGPDGGVFVTREKTPLTKLDANGQTVWSRSWENAPDLASVVVKPDGGYLLGGCSSASTLDLGAGVVARTEDSGETIFVASYAADGAYQWDVHFSAGNAGSKTTIRRPVLDPQGNVWIAGTLDGAIGIGDQTLASAGGLDVFVAKLDPVGHLLLARVFGTSQDEALGDFAVDGSGRAVLTGWFEGSVDFDAVALTKDPTVPRPSLFVAKLQATGQVAWARSSVDGDRAESGEFLAIDRATNAIWLAGSRQYYPDGQSRDWFLAKLAP